MSETGIMDGSGPLRLPQTKISRQRRIVELLGQQEVSSQAQLADVLAADGFGPSRGLSARPC